MISHLERADRFRDSCRQDRAASRPDCALQRRIVTHRDRRSDKDLPEHDRRRSGHLLSEVGKPRRTLHVRMTGRLNVIATVLSSNYLGAIGRWTSSRPRSTGTLDIFSRICSMAWEGSKPLGQTSGQFMIVRRGTAGRHRSGRQPLLRRVVPAVEDEPIRLYETGRSDELVRIPPERRALAAAAGTQNALIGAVQLVALRW